MSGDSTLLLMAVFGTLSTLRAQLARPDHFAPALDYLAQALEPGHPIRARILAVPVGETRRVELGNGCFALEQAYLTKRRPAGRFEAHNALVDLQAVVAGHEVMEVIDRGELTLVEDLLATRDLAFYADVVTASRWQVRPGEVAVFFPVDAHMPSLAPENPGVVYKTVVKVPVPA